MPRDSDDRPPTNESYVAILFSPHPRGQNLFNEDAKEGGAHFPGVIIACLMALAPELNSSTSRPSIRSHSMYLGIQLRASAAELPIRRGDGSHKVGAAKMCLPKKESV